MTSHKIKNRTALMSPALTSWTLLNDFLREASESECMSLMKKERAGKGRRQYMLRIHARFNKTRAERERNEILTGLFE